MDSKNYHTTILVNASPAEAMKKISEVKKWWAKKTSGKSEKPGDEFKVDFGQTFVDFRISALEPAKRLVWTVTGCNLHWIKDKKEWNGTEVVFELSGKGKQTQIDFTHVGITPESECYNECKPGWDEHVGESLLKHINEGKGTPV